MNIVFLKGRKSAPNLREYKEIPIEEVFGRKITIENFDVMYRFFYKYLVVYATLDNVSIKFTTSSTVLEKQLENIKGHLPAMGIVNKVLVDDGYYYHFLCVKRTAYERNAKLKEFVKEVVRWIK